MKSRWATIAKWTLGAIAMMTPGAVVVVLYC